MPTPPVAGVLAWYAADQITSPPASGSALTAWNDLSGNGYTASQATGADQPTYDTNVQNSLPAVLFNGSSDVLKATIASLSQPFTIFAVVQTSSASVNLTYISDGGNVRLGDGDKSYVYAGGTPLIGSAITSWKYVTVQVDGASSYIRDNGTQTASGNPGSTAWGTALYLGANGSSSLFWNGYIGEILVYPSALSSGDVSTVETYLYDKWFVTTVAGTGSGSYSFSGTAAGTWKLPGTGSGSYTFTGTAAGKLLLPAHATGIYSFAGTATGKLTLHASATGSYAFTGTAAGSAATPPTVLTLPPTALPGLQEQLNGSINPNGSNTTTYFFEWGETTAYGNTTPSVNPGSGVVPVLVNATVSDLSPGVLYHYRIAATNSLGTAYGADETFYPFAPPQPSISLPSQTNPFTYCCYDLLTGAYKGQLPLTQVNFGSQVLTPGTFSGQLDIASTAMQLLGPTALTSPARTALLVDYLGSFVWGGIIWPRNYQWDSTHRTFTINATELWSYFNSRAQATDYSAPPTSGITGPNTNMAIWDATLTAVGDGGLGVFDPMLIAWQMLYDALYLVPNGNPLNMGIAANGYATPAAYLASDTATPYNATDGGNYISVSYPYQSIQMLAMLINQIATNGFLTGFDYAVDVAGSAGGPVTATVNLSYPRRGRLYSENRLVLDQARAISMQLPEDGTQAGDTMYEQGSSGALSVSQNIDPLSSGYPVLEQLKSRANITSANIMNVLEQLGAADLEQFSYPPATPVVTCDALSGPITVGQFVVGDDCRWFVPATDGAGNVFDPRFPAGLDTEARINGYSITVGDEGQSTVAFTLGEPPAAAPTSPWLPS